MYSYIINLTQDKYFSINTSVYIYNVNNFCKHIIKYNEWNNYDELILIINNNHTVLRFNEPFGIVEHIDMSFILHNNINVFDNYAAFLTNKRNSITLTPQPKLHLDTTFNNIKEYYYYIFEHFSNNNRELTINNNTHNNDHDEAMYDDNEAMFYDDRNDDNDMYDDRNDDNDMYDSECWESIDL